jgi:uncharacterized protein GlcG (DUF336 family)
MLSLKQALDIANSVLAQGKSSGFAPLSVAILDPGAHILVVLRNERASIGRPDIALAKAAGCLAMGFGGRELAFRAQAAPQFFGALTQVFHRGIVPAAGGVLIRDANGELLGAVGVSGDTSDNDEVCAVAGVRAAELIADTGAPGA